MREGKKSEGGGGLLKPPGSYRVKPKHIKAREKANVNSAITNWLLRKNLSLLISVREGDHLLLGFTSYEIAELINELAIM